MQFCRLTVNYFRYDSPQHCLWTSYMTPYPYSYIHQSTIEEHMITPHARCRCSGCKSWNHPPHVCEEPQPGLQAWAGEAGHPWPGRCSHPPAPSLDQEAAPGVVSARPRPRCPSCSNELGEAGFPVEVDLLRETFLQPAWRRVLLLCSQDLWLPGWKWRFKYIYKFFQPPGASLRNLLCWLSSEGQRQ